MNEGKRGAAYGYPDSFVQILDYIKAYFVYHTASKERLFLEFTSEVHDSKLIDNTSENNRVKRVLADSMYYSNKKFLYLG